MPGVPVIPSAIVATRGLVSISLKCPQIHREGVGNFSFGLHAFCTRSYPRSADRLIAATTCGSRQPSTVQFEEGRSRFVLASTVKLAAVAG